MINTSPKRYTRIRQIYAWIGFTTLVVLAPVFVGGFVYTINFMIAHASEIF